MALDVRPVLRRVTALFAAVCAATFNLALTSCSNSQPTAYDSGRLDRIENRLNNVEVKQIEQGMKLNSWALLEPGNKGFQAIQTEAGSIAVSFQNIRPYGNGSRVELDVGNLTSANISDITADVSWGTADEKGYKDKELGKREKYLMEGGFPAGNWRRYTLDIPAVAPEKLGYIAIENVTFSHLQMPTIQQVG
jgi:hypothetical protein